MRPAGASYYTEGTVASRSTMSEWSALWSNGRFTRLWTARVVSRFGSSLGYVVLIWYTFAQTGSALAVVYVGLAAFIPTAAFGLFSGAVVDRYRRRTVIVLSSLGRGAAMGGLVVVLYLLGFDLSLIVLASAVFAICATFFGPGAQALLTEIVAREHLDRANGLFESTESIVGIAGSALAGVAIVTVGAVPSLGVDAAAYVVGALFVALIGVTATSRHLPVSEERFLGQVREGWAYLRRAMGLLQLTVVALVSNFLWSIVLTFLVVYTAVTLHGSSVVYGGIEAALAAGWGLGGLSVSRFRLTRYTGWLFALTGLIEGVAILLLVLVPSVPLAVPLFLAIGVWQGILNVAWLSSVQALVPPQLQGRYLATDNAISYASIPAAQVLGGVLIVLSGLPFTYLVAAIGSLSAGAGFLSLGSLRRFGYDPRTVARAETATEYH